LELFSLEEEAAQLPGGLFVLRALWETVRCCGKTKRIHHRDTENTETFFQDSALVKPLAAAPPPTDTSSAPFFGLALTTDHWLLTTDY
jgi:hypothetical protein